MGYSKEDDHEEEMSRLGAIALIFRCIKHLWVHGGSYLPLLLLIVFPIAAFGELCTVWTELHPILPADFVRQIVANNFTDVAANEPGMIILATTSGFAGGLFQTVLITIQYICIAYTVANILTNKTVVLADVVDAVRRLWGPAILTSLCYYVITFGVLGIGWTIVSTLFLISNSTLLLLARLALLFDAVLLVSLGFAFQLLYLVPILEGVYGWKALGKSWELLQGKKWVALRINILVYLLLFSERALSSYFCYSILLLLGFPINSTPAFVVSHALGIVMGSVEIILFMTTETFLYFSCKASHRESITDSDFFQMQVMKGGYEQIPGHSESYDVESAKEKGSQVHSEKPL